MGRPVKPTIPILNGGSAGSQRLMFAMTIKVGSVLFVGGISQPLRTGSRQEARISMIATRRRRARPKREQPCIVVVVVIGRADLPEQTDRELRGAGYTDRNMHDVRMGFRLGFEHAVEHIKAPVKAKE